VRRTTSLLLLAAALGAPAVLSGQGHDRHPAPSGASASAREAHSPELRAQLEAVRQATERYRDHAAAVRDGYRLFGDEGPLMGEHWYHPRLTRAPLDLARPATLQYATIGGRKVLVGVAYTLYRRDGEPLPEGFVGEADRWHTHDMAKLVNAALAQRPVLRGIANRRLRRNGGRALLTMVHAWVWEENPDGLFADRHRALPYLRAGLPAEWAAGSTEAAAQGVALLSGGCATETKRTDRMAGLDGRQARELEAACARIGAALRATVEAAREPRAVNAAAEAAWADLEAERERILLPAQRARMERLLASVTEPHEM
jgi:hypothetical protein